MRYTRETKQWINALRSDNHDQARGCLYDSIDDAYCCLGVAHKVVFNGGFEPDDDVDASSRQGLTIDGDFMLGMLPEDECEAMGMSRYDEADLAEMNDDGDSFAHIADVIEYAAMHDTSIKNALEEMLSS